MRQIHHWAALLFIGSILVHLLRIFFTGAFRKPRELNWMVGLTLVPARTRATASPATAFRTTCSRAPGCASRTRCCSRSRSSGRGCAFLVFGGEFPSNDIIPRLFVIHVLIVPALIVGLLTIHLGDARAPEAHAVPPDKAAPSATSWAPSSGRRSPRRRSGCSSSCSRCARRSAASRRSTRCGSTARSTRRRSARDHNPTGTSAGSRARCASCRRGSSGSAASRSRTRSSPASCCPGITFTVLYLWPCIEERLTKDHADHHLLDRPRDRPAAPRSASAVLAFYVVLFLAGGNDVIAAHLDLSVNAVTYVFRVLLFVLPAVAALVTYRLCKELAARDRVARRTARRARAHRRGRLRRGRVRALAARASVDCVTPGPLARERSRGPRRRARASASTNPRAADHHEPGAEREAARHHASALEADGERPDRAAWGRRRSGRRRRRSTRRRGPPPRAARAGTATRSSRRRRGPSPRSRPASPRRPARRTRTSRRRRSPRRTP